MDRYAAIDQIRVVAEKVLGEQAPAIDENTRLLEGLGLDSTGILEILMELEDAIGFEVDIDTLDPGVFQTAGSLADYIANATSEN